MNQKAGGLLRHIIKDALHSCLLHRKCNFLKLYALFACLLDQCHSLLLLCLSRSHPTLVDILMPCKCGFLILNPIYIKTHFLLTWLRHEMISLMTCLLQVPFLTYQNKRIYLIPCVVFSSTLLTVMSSWYLQCLCYK